MANETVTAATANTSSTVVSEIQKTPTAQEILSRSAAPEKSALVQDVSMDDLKSSIKFDDIKDPIARQLAEKRIKELEAGFNKKYEQIATLRKDLESKSGQSRQWTQEELDRELKNPAFISLVQARQQQAAANQPPAEFEGNADEWSALTPVEKQHFAQLTQKVSAQEQFMMDMLKTQEDSKLKTSYPDYDSQAVDQIQRDLLSGKVQATREHLWKVANFDSAIQKAYQLGLKDRNSSVTEKLNASSGLASHNVTSTNEIPEDLRKKKDPIAIGRWRLAQVIAGRK